MGSADCRLPVYEDTRELLRERKRRGESWDGLLRRLAGADDPEAHRD